MDEKLTDEQLDYMSHGYGYVNAEGLIDLTKELISLRAAWKIAEPHLPQDVYRRALAALDASR